MEIKDMQMSDIEARSAELETALTAENADIEGITAEVTELEERKAQIVAEAEERKAQIAEVEKTAVEVHEIDERKETMNMEIRNTNEYIEAYAKYIKTGDDKECRELLTDEKAYQKMSEAVNPYGDGHASERIRSILEEVLCKE